MISKEVTSEPWKLGVLFSRTGCTAVAERTQLCGTLLAIAEINAAGGINGRELVPIIYDPGSEAAAFGQFAKRLMIDDGVTMIFGCYTSSGRKAVLPVVERLNGLLWYPTLYEGFELSSNVIYTGAAPNQNNLVLCRYLVERYGSRFYFVGSDYVYPRESNRIMRKILCNSGCEVVGEAYLCLRAQRSDFLPVLHDIRDKQPDVIFSTVVGDSTVHFYTAYAEANFDSTVMPIASLTTTEAELSAMGFDVGKGHITAASYFQCVDGAQNSSFVAGYKRRYGDDQPTNMCAEAAFFQINLFARALAQTNCMDADVLRPVVLGSSLQAPQGKVSINPSCNHSDLWMRVGRANERGQFDILYQSSSPVVPDPYLIENGMSARRR